MDGKRILAAGLGVALALGGEQLVESRTDQRAAYPDNLVCNTTLVKGESPKSLAAQSLFKADAGTVIERSQFINPDALLRYTAHDNGHYSTDGLYNVMVQKKKDEPFYEIPPSSFSPSNIRYSTCDFANTSIDISRFPKKEAAVKILNSTVAVIESQPRDTKHDSLVTYRRCGAIAIGSHRLLLPNTGFVPHEQACDSLARGETDHGQLLRISGDNNIRQWRVLKYNGQNLDSVEIADNYKPKTGDELIYSGYDHTGSREYFRVSVAGKSEDGRILLRAGIDQLGSPDTYGKINYATLDSGTGGFFTYDGKLVAISEGTAKFNDLINDYGFSEQYKKFRADQNQQLTDTLDKFGFNSDYYYEAGHPIDEQQFVFALRVSSDNLADLGGTIKSNPKS